MKKKKQTSTAATTTANDDPTEATVNVGDIKTLIKDHANFFDKLVELIPAKFYLPTNDDDKPWFQGLSKAEKAKAKRKSIENTKKSRRDRLDPEKSSKTTLDLLKESLESENGPKLEFSDDEGGGGGGGDGGDGEGVKVRGLKEESKVSYEELRERLHRKIKELAASRGDGSGSGSGSGRRKREWERREKAESNKRKRNDGGGGGGEKEVERESERDIEREASEAAKDIEFGKVKLAASNDDVLNKKKRKLSKEKELKRALELEEAKKDPEKGKVVAEKHAWKTAANRAMGVKVHDNPKLLKQSMHKDKKKHKKSVENWKKRVETTQKMKQEKQEKRRGNIKAKIDKKKQAKIDKREKKLMRPGFEGRKEGFITGE